MPICNNSADTTALEYKGGITVIETIHAYYNGSVFVPLAPVKVKLNQPVLITVFEAANTKTGGKRYVEFFGALSTENYSEIIEALKDTERLDLDEW